MKYSQTNADSPQSSKCTEGSKGWLKFCKQSKPADSNQLKSEKVRILIAKSSVKTGF